MVEIERRTLPTEFEVRAGASGDTATIVGYAYKFGARSQNLGGFRETIADGAGATSAASDDIRALFNHDPNLILGRTASGTMRAAEDSTGLHYEITADTRQSYVRDLMVAFERGDVTQSSFAFRVNGPDGEAWAYDETQTPLRTILSMTLYDVSPVTYPAYLASESGIGQRALDGLAAFRAAMPDPTDAGALWVPPAVPDPTDAAIRARIVALRG